MSRLRYLGALILISGVISSCCSTKKAGSMKSNEPTFSPSPKAIIYQTKKDYSNLVPVILSEDKKSIQSYPDIKDIYFNGKLAYPTPLHKGFWLDNRGINSNVAFIKLTYEEYSKLPKTPLPEELMNMIIDYQPIVSMYVCGPRSAYLDIVQEVNIKIDAGDFSGFLKVK
jgi:hypothetical protein